MERFMRQHSYMSGLSSACPLPLLAQFALILLHIITYYYITTWRMNGALKR